MKGILAVVVVMLCVHSCVGWWQTGHMLVAQIAYNFLNPQESAEIRQALENAMDALHTYSDQSSTFVTAACWMDDLKTRDLSQFSNWHYINLPYCTDNNTFCVNNPVSGMLYASGSVVWAINSALYTLKSNNAGGFERGFALKNLLHLVGDIHQPLHTVALYSAQLPNGDRGGNDFLITGVPGVSELHALWDGGVGLLNNNINRPLTKAGKQYIEQTAHELMTNFSASSIDNTTTVANWALEGLNLAQSVVYTLAFNSTPSQDYYNAAQPVVRQQLAKAGYRLAQILKQIVVCNQDTHNCPTEKKVHKSVFIAVSAVLCVGLVLSVIINVFIIHKYRNKHGRNETAPLLK